MNIHFRNTFLLMIYTSKDSKYVKFAKNGFKYMQCHHAKHTLWETFVCSLFWSTHLKKITHKITIMQHEHHVARVIAKLKQDKKHNPNLVADI